MRNQDLATTQEEELMLFAILLECTVQQINCLEGIFKHNAKRWVNELQRTGRRTIGEMYKVLDGDGEFHLGEMFDYMYMHMRNAAQAETENAPIFTDVVKQLLEAQKKSKELGMPMREYLTANPFQI